MKVESTFSAQQQGGTQPRAQAQAARWLADLEQALLDAWRQPAHADAGAQAPPPGAPDSQRQFAPQDAPVDEDARVAEPAEASAATEATPQHALAGQRHPEVEAASQATACTAGDRAPCIAGLESRAEASGAKAALRAAPGAPALEVKAVLATPLAMVEPLASNPASGTPRPRPLTDAPVSSQQDEPAQAAAREAAPRYAKRLFHLAWGQEVQASVRDTQLTGEQRQSVAQALARQLRRDGVPLRRVYVNGQVFEISIPTHPEE
jgi:hypothetical protein